MTTVNMDVVDLLLDCRSFNFETFPDGLQHNDGRPFTEDECRLAGQATMAELRAVTDYQATVIDYLREQYDLSVEFATLTAPYFARYGTDATLGDLRPLMTPEDGQRFDHLVSRINGLA